ncbi:hypothetical protein TRVL_02572 [Trypanosoma vivax]|nr:hypothetical protein TRVL_02572 [Trypanosoma vivax]
MDTEAGKRKRHRRKVGPTTPGAETLSRATAESGASHGAAVWSKERYLGTTSGILRMVSTRPHRAQRGQRQGVRGLRASPLERERGCGADMRAMGTLFAPARKRHRGDMSA